MRSKSWFFKQLHGYLSNCLGIQLILSNGFDHRNILVFVKRKYFKNIKHIWLQNKNIRSFRLKKSLFQNSIHTTSPSLNNHFIILLCIFPVIFLCVCINKCQNAYLFTCDFIMLFCTCFLLSGHPTRLSLSVHGEQKENV